jgi:hypothetical protein
MLSFHVRQLLPPRTALVVSPLVTAAPDDEAGTELSKRTQLTCDDCYFRRAGLCALPTDAPCPTFRLHSRGSLVPPRQPRLVPRPLGDFTQPAT